MTVAALVSGVLWLAPEHKTSRGGKDYVLAKLREGHGDRTAWWNIFAFPEEARAELARLGAGDAVSVSGNFTVGTYVQNGETRLSFTLYANRVVSAHRPRRERAKRAAASDSSDASIDPDHRESFDDDMPS